MLPQWTELDWLGSMDNKLKLYEAYAKTNGNLVESNDRENSEAFIRLSDMGSKPIVNNNYILVSLMLLHDELSTIVKPQLVELTEITPESYWVKLVQTNNREVEFQKFHLVEFPNKTGSVDIPVITMLCDSLDNYEKIRMFVELKFGTTLPKYNGKVIGENKMSNILKGIVDEAPVAEDDLDENLHKWFKEKWVRFGPDGKIRGPCARGSDSEGKPKCLPQKKAQNLGKKGRKYAASKKRREDPNPERSGKAINVATKKKTNEGEVVKGPWTKSVPQQQTGTASGDNVHRLNMLDIQKVAKEFINSKYFHGMLAPDSDSIEEVADDVVLFLFKRYPEMMKKYSYDQIIDRAYQISKSAHELGGVTPFNEDACPNCGGELVDESMMNEKQDACYRKVKARYKVWPSAYASGALVQCRKKGASNWGTKSESTIMKGIMKEEDDEPVTLYANGEPFLKYNNMRNAQAEMNKMQAKFPHIKLTLRKEGGESSVVVYVDGKPMVKYNNVDDAENAIKKMKSKFPHKKYDIKQEMLESAYEKDLSDNEPRIVSGVYGAKSKMFRKKFRSQRDQDRYFDNPDREGNYEIHYVQRVDEASSPAQQAAIAINMKKQGKKPKNEDTSMQFAAERTPAINPYGGLKDRQHRGTISEMPDTSGPVGTQEGGWRKYKTKVNERDLSEIDFSSSLGDLANPDEIIKNAKKSGTIGSRPVMLYRSGPDSIYFFATKSNIDALLYLRGDRLLGMKNFSSNKGLVYNLFQYLINIKKQKLKLNSSDKLTSDGIDWVINQINRPTGFKITDQKGNMINPEKLYQEWENARETGMHGPTSIVIGESIDSKKIYENESRLIPMDIFGATLSEYERFNVPDLFEDEVKEEELDEKCWSGYTQLGKKLKAGKMVPNCVKKESTIMKGIKRE